MATRSFIAMKVEGGGYRGVYCHWNGSPKLNGVTLRDHYHDRAKVEQLIDMGSISVLSKEIGERHSFYQAAAFDDSHGWSTFFHRDRADSWNTVKPQEFSSFPDLSQGAINNDADWLYLFEDGRWLCGRVGRFWGVGISDLHTVDQWLEMTGG